MAFVKLDCGILNSTIWVDRIARELFITSLLMAEPRELTEAMPQIAIGQLAYTGWEVPPGWYGFVEAAGPGIIHRAGLDDKGPLFQAATDALVRLGEPEPESRSHAFEGRRLIRVNGGFVVLNYIDYRDKDSTTAERSRRWRERQKAKKQGSSRVTDTPSRVIRHQVEAEAEAEVRTESTAPAPKTAPCAPHAQQEQEPQAREEDSLLKTCGISVQNGGSLGKQPSGDNYQVIARLAGYLLEAGQWTHHDETYPISSESNLMDALKDECARLGIVRVGDVVHRAAASAWTKRQIGVGRRR